MMGLPPMMGDGENFWDEPDFVLTYIVGGLVNGMGLEIGVTLMLRGLVVSGTLVSETRYLEEMTTILQDQVQFTGADVPDEAMEALKQVLDLRTMTEADPIPVVDYDEDDPPDPEDLLDEDIPAALQHLHLHNPTIVAGEPPINFEDGANITLRLRMTAIDGWMIGQLRQDPPLDFMNLDDGGVAH